MNARLYTPEILRLAASIPHQQRLAPPCASAERRSAICGSRVCADVELDGSGRVVRFGQEVEACALGQASAAIMGQAVLGMTAAELLAARAALARWLQTDGPLPAGLASRFPGLCLLAAARAHPARHPSILLAFDAALAAAEAAATKNVAAEAAETGRG